MQVPRNHFRKVRNQRELSMVSQTHTYTGIAIGLCSLELDTGVNFKAGARTALLFGHKYFIYTHLQHPALLQRSKQGARPSQLTDTRLGTSEAKAGDRPLLIRLGAFRRGRLCSVGRPSARGLPKFEVCRRLPCRPRGTGAALSSATRPDRTCCPHPRLSLLGTGRRLFRGRSRGA